ncbi:hypothetical protein PJL18_04375 [Paenarthrobacter nicotinovorans]|nr:hypothetical protein [Paenarthrobacter nicotinovorans]
MCPCGGVLDDQCVRALLGSGEGFLNTGHTGDNECSGLLQGPDHFAPREAESETHHFHRVRHEDVDLLLPGVIVIEAKRGQSDTVARSLWFQLGAVGFQPCPLLGPRRQCVRVRNKDVDAEPDPQRPRSGDLRSHGPGTLVPGSEEAQSAGLMDSVYQLRC